MRRFALAPIVLLVLLALPATAVADTAAGKQLAWVLDVLARGGVADKATLEAHFHPSFLAHIPADKLAEALRGLAGHLAGMKILETTPTGDTKVVARGQATEARFVIALDVDPPSGQIARLEIRPDTGTRPKSMDEALQLLTALAPRTNLLVAALDDGSCRPLHQKNASDALAIGSVFKLYVLLALADRVAAGRLTWEQKLTVRDAWRSLPPPTDPPGAKLTVRALAERMISVSDNTAADVLLYTVGRKNVEAALVTAHHAHPAANIPFFGTRELFWMKMAVPAGDVKAYLATSSPEKRRGYLDRLAGKVPTGSFADWKSARYIDELEWFASAEDLCRLDATLLARKGAVLDIMGKNAGLDADAKKGFSYIGFKGGSEPGVIVGTWLLHRDDGKWFFVTVGANGPDAIDEGTFLGLGAGVVQLVASEGKEGEEGR